MIFFKQIARAFDLLVVVPLQIYGGNILLERWRRAMLPDACTGERGPEMPLQKLAATQQRHVHAAEGTKTVGCTELQLET
jgi:hypothetical protein